LSGSLEYAARTRHPPRRADRASGSPVARSANPPTANARTTAPARTASAEQRIVAEAAADPRLEGRAVKRVAFDAATIADRVRSLGEEIAAAYPADEPLLVLGLLKGSFIFLADLVRGIERPVQVDFLVASSYGAGTTSSGNVRLLYDPATDLDGKHVLLVEDIIDTGKTLQRLMSLLSARRPRSLAICALLDKHLAPEPPAELRFVGFDAPPAFLVGYGLDHAENFRHLPFIGDLE
jgi:hypoxanthine phosphoribosyltransferase